MTFMITDVKFSPRLRWHDRLAHSLWKHREHRCWDVVTYVNKDWTAEIVRRQRHCKLCEPYRFHETITTDVPVAAPAMDDIVYRSREPYSDDYSVVTDMSVHWLGRPDGV